jgi:hypothetical protein
MAVRFSEICVDSRNPRRLAEFWAAVLGWQISGPDDAVEIADPSAAAPSIVFVPVPEPKKVKNRLHIDVTPVGSAQAAEVQRVLDLGARHADVGQGEQTWVVLADPEGNEFCILSAPSA